MENLTHLIRAFRLFLPLLAIGLLVAINSCSERKHDNPFDPEGQNEPPLILSTNSRDNSTIQLSWRWAADPINDYSGFRIYRSVDSQNFILYREIPKGRFSFVDSSAQAYHWYYYKISIYGPGVESISSQSQRVFLGDGIYWILSKYGFWIRKVSYDLQRSLNYYNTTYPAEEWAVSINDSLIWLAFTLYGDGVSNLNLRTASEDFFYFGNLTSPVDVEYDPQQNKAYALDERTPNDKIAVFQNNALQLSIDLPQGNYFKLFLSNPNQQLIILGEKKCLKLSLVSMTITDSLLIAADYTGQDMDASADSIFILASSMQGSTIYKLSFSDMSQNTVNVDGDFYRITYASQSDQFYLAEDVPSAQDRVVKLSAQGSRLLQLSGFEYVGQVGLNPHDQSIVVLDRLGDRLFLFDRNGNEVSRSAQNAFYDPIRIFIE